MTQDFHELKNDLNGIPSKIKTCSKNIPSRENQLSLPVRRRFLHVCLRLDGRDRLQGEDGLSAGQEGQAANLGKSDAFQLL